MQQPGKYRLMFLVITGLVMLLPILAVLQYRWIGQLSSSEVDRLRSNLQTSARHFGRAIDHEISPAQWTFRVSFTESIEEVARQLRSGHRMWSIRSPQSDLIEAIYWVNYDLEKNLLLYQFDPGTGQLNPLPWPADLKDWHAYFIERTRRQLEFYQPFQSNESPLPEQQSDFLALSARLMVERPAIIIPVSIDSEIASANLLANLNATTTGIAGHTFITLDKDHLTGVLFPSLSDTLIHSIEQDVDVMIVSTMDSTRVIYQSSDALNIAHFDEPDARQPIGRFRWMPFTSLSRLAAGYASLLERDQVIADSMIFQLRRHWSPAMEDSIGLYDTYYSTDYPFQAIIRLAKEEQYEGELTAEHLLMALTRQSTAPDPLPPPPGAPPHSPPSITSASISPPAHAWKLLVQHKKGSLETVALANQRRNLFMSFGILSILGVAILFMYTSAQRAHKLAERQMNFVAGVSHELRTPLAVILSASQNLADGVISDSGRLKKYGELISKEGHRLSDMIEQTLQLAGIQSGKNTYSKEKISVRALVSEALSAWDKTLREHDFKVNINIESSLPPITGDPRALQMTLSNLISNAFKYSNGRRRIDIRAKQAVDGKHAEILIEVEDRGIGIPPDEQNQIFEQFFRGQEATKAQIHGNGIGLSIVKETMEAHQGSVSVQSYPNSGSIFTLHFPIQTHS